MNNYNINIQNEKLEQICRKYFIKELSLFGSVLREDFRADSDVDLLIEFEKNSRITLFDLVDVKEEFEKLFGRNIDIVSKNAIRKSRNQIRKKAILDNHRIIYLS